MLVRVHQCRLTKVSTLPEAEENNNHTDNSEYENKEKTIITKSMPNQESRCENYCDTDSENEGDNNVETVENDDNAQQVTNAMAETERPKISDMKIGQTIRYRNVDSGEQSIAKVTGRAGKATGNNKNWFNLQYLEPDTLKGAEISVYLSKVEELENVTPEVEPNPGPDDDSVMIFEDVSFKDAKLKELISWKNNNVYDEHKDTGQKCNSTRWICSLKDTSEGTIHKARLVARGFEEINRDIPKDSPTCGTDSLRLVLAILAQIGWKTRTMDIKTAYLQGAEIERKIFLKPPPEAQCIDVVWQLRKCVWSGRCLSELV